MRDDFDIHALILAVQVCELLGLWFESVYSDDEHCRHG